MTQNPMNSKGSGVDYFAHTDCIPMEIATVIEEATVTAAELVSVMVIAMLLVAVFAMY